MHCLSAVPWAGCILPLRVVMTVRWFSARLVVAPYGADWECVKLFGKSLFDLLCGGRFCPNDCLLSYLVLNVCGLHNYIMVKLRSSRRRIACR